MSKDIGTSSWVEGLRPRMRRGRRSSDSGSARVALRAPKRLGLVSALPSRFRFQTLPQTTRVWRVCHIGRSLDMASRAANAALGSVRLGLRSQRERTCLAEAWLHRRRPALRNATTGRPRRPLLQRLSGRLGGERSIKVCFLPNEPN